MDILLSFKKRALHRIQVDETQRGIGGRQKEMGESRKGNINKSFMYHVLCIHCSGCFPKF